MNSRICPINISINTIDKKIVSGTTITKQKIFDIWYSSIISGVILARSYLKRLPITSVSSLSKRMVE